MCSYFGQSFCSLPSFPKENQKDKERPGWSFSYKYMKSLNSLSLGPESKSKGSRWCGVLLAVTLLFVVFFVGTVFMAPDYNERISRWGITDRFQSLRFGNCKNQCRPPGSEALPRGIVSETSNLLMRPLWGFPEKNAYSSSNLFAMAVGIKQKDLVNKMVKKFLSSNFSVMLFHYDGFANEWKDFEWSNQVIHVSAGNQTKWWFAKRFLHPDIVAEYNYIFLWDEDLGVQNFDPKKYLSIIEREGLEISQPALDPGKSEVHQQITARVRSEVHRRTYKQGSCYWNSTAPPCTGWVEMMAPVFSQAAWRCVWYMIQNDLIHAWGLDRQLGYCAQGDRTKKIGVVDAEYIVHYGRPTLGGMGQNKAPTPSKVHKVNPRLEVRRQSYRELVIFQRRWKNAAKEDQCWVDPYKQQQP